jgi:hypothetical protein
VGEMVFGQDHALARAQPLRDEGAHPELVEQPVIMASRKRVVARGNIWSDVMRMRSNLVNGSRRRSRSPRRRHDPGRLQHVVDGVVGKLEVVLLAGEALLLAAATSRPSVTRASAASWKTQEVSRTCNSTAARPA